MLRLRPVHFTCSAGTVADANKRCRLCFKIEMQSTARRERTIKRRATDGHGMMAGLIQHRHSDDARVRRDAFMQQAISKNQQRRGE